MQRPLADREYVLRCYWCSPGDTDDRAGLTELLKINKILDYTGTPSPFKILAKDRTDVGGRCDTFTAHDRLGIIACCPVESGRCIFHSGLSQFSWDESLAAFHLNSVFLKNGQGFFAFKQNPCVFQQIDRSVVNPLQLFIGQNFKSRYTCHGAPLSNRFARFLCPFSGYLSTIQRQPQYRTRWSLYCVFQWRHLPPLRG